MVDDPILTDLFGFDGEDERWLDELRRARTPAAPGGRLGRFDVLERVARGGQGTVYRARDPRTGSEVALKLLEAGSHAGPGARRRFRREVRAAAALAHPSIVRVFGVEPVGDQPALWMEWIDGVPLTQWARGEERSAESVLRLFAEVCDAVHHAHQHGVLHRDLKPSNVLVDDADRPHVLDFGLAKLAGDDEERTRTGLFLGTPGYASPEQRERGAADVDARSDVYSIGVLLHEALVGRRPAGSTSASAERRDVRRELDVVLGTALAVAPEERYSSVDALAEDLRRYLAGEPLLAHPPSGWYQLRKLAGRNRAATALGALTVAALAAFAVHSRAFASAMAHERNAARLSGDAARAHAARAHAARARAESAAARARDAADEEERFRAEAEDRRADSGRDAARALAARDEADRQRERAEDFLTLFLEDAPSGLVPYARGERLESDEALLALAAGVTEAYPERPELRLLLRQRVGRLLARRGRSAEWLATARESAAIAGETLPGSRLHFDALWDLGQALRPAVDAEEERLDVLERTVALAREVDGAEASKVFRAFDDLGRLREDRGEHDAARQCWETAARYAWDRGLAESTKHVFLAHALRARAVSGGGERAAELARGALEEVTGRFGPASLESTLYHQVLATVALARGEWGAACERLRAALAWLDTAEETAPMRIGRPELEAYDVRVERLATTWLLAFARHRSGDEAGADEMLAALSRLLSAPLSGPVRLGVERRLSDAGRLAEVPGFLASRSGSATADAVRLRPSSAQPVTPEDER